MLPGDSFGNTIQSWLGTMVSVPNWKKTQRRRKMKRKGRKLRKGEMKERKLVIMKGLPRNHQRANITKFLLHLWVAVQELMDIMLVHHLIFAALPKLVNIMVVVRRILSHPPVTSPPKLTRAPLLTSTRNPRGVKTTMGLIPLAVAGSLRKIIVKNSPMASRKQKSGKTLQHPLPGQATRDPGFLLM